STPQAGSEMAPADAGIEVELFDPAVEQAGSVAAGPRVATGRPVAIAPSVGIAFFAMIFVFYGLMFLGFLAMMAFAFWFGTKTMFVMPLIADRGCSFLEALTESWRLTSTRFWELLLTYALASIIAGIGVYFCYVGALATMPLYYTIIAAVYEAHALPQFTPEAEIVPAGPNAGPGA
ncbi:MAG TPA: glycerophosphoryl diester phosphodiesterase membrane domain-containing protein, partial [Planctomycetaceae bacterium]|nr:glycerophosphoryl diester phosphodiesterase membrane domain-containing protein [Planctomycetaceae bacterium]